ncbi:UNVERIFIED_CONTAM: NDR1/HIN1-like protein 6 [Sesamum radiatum]|uniref:NDR1/HIN1-like protein 6 n=1 Tax=Sesamum radiatum TaxID=300843 RepID=A0AAW2KMX8_SESRA
MSTKTFPDDCISSPTRRAPAGKPESRQQQALQSTTTMSLHTAPITRREEKLLQVHLLLCCCALAAFFVLAILTFFFYNMYKPKVPSYDIQDLRVKSFDLQPGSILNTELLVNVKADNPNSHIGFTYGDDSSIDVVYSDANLCTGKLPYFYQGHQNTTLMTIDLVGKSVLASGVQEDFAQRQKEGKIPLLVKVKVPLRIVIGNMPLRQFKVFLNCSLVVDSLTPNKKVGVLSSNTTLYFEF